MQDPADVRRRKEGLIGDQNRPMPTAGTNTPLILIMAMNDDVLMQETLWLKQNVWNQMQKDLIAESKRFDERSKSNDAETSKEDNSKKDYSKKDYT